MTGPSYITMTSDANVPPAGTRASESLLGQLAIIQSPNAFPAVQARTGANYYRFVGVVFRGVEGVATGTDTTRDIVSVGDGTETDAALLPSHFVFDRVLIRGDATYGAKRGILGNGHDITLEYSDMPDHLPERPGYERFWLLQLRQALSAFSTTGWRPAPR